MLPKHIWGSLGYGTPGRSSDQGVEPGELLLDIGGAAPSRSIVIYSSEMKRAIQSARSKYYNYNRPGERIMLKCSI